ncbi:DUF2182 domain-containing protein [Mangrovitalea sediminis]|uniref:DUF2182 domain-containing protein n=1 Tax=Mangrovitalea sediminis TaxID=1982043 RepID=UPI000BE4EBB0|nr:DUF2182 domain-containing protein [Mangrovitalea sediminis]
MNARWWPLIAILVVGGLAWGGFIQLGAQGVMMSGMAMGPAMLALMWVVMMVAMMVPAAAPSYLMYSRMAPQRWHSGFYLTGYLAVWAGIGLLYAGVQWALRRSGFMAPDLTLAQPVAAGVLLIVAGLWQWSPWKGRCVARCRSPLGFLLNEWQAGSRGALLMGLRYAGWCVGCCWLLMAVLFVAGTMSFVAALAIAAYILLERLLPLGRPLDRVVGAGLAVWGGWLLVAA